MIDIEIDPQFKRQLRVLSNDERERLETSLLDEGCRDPLVLWDGVLLDGHNRYEICKEHGIPYTVEEIELPDRTAAEHWIDNNQLSRRNLTNDERRLIRGRMYNRMKKAHGDRGPEKTGQNDQSFGQTSEELAKQFGVSEKTVRRDGKFAEEVQADPRLMDAVRKKKPVREAKKAIAEIELDEELAKIPADDREPLAEMVKSAPTSADDKMHMAKRLATMPQPERTRIKVLSQSDEEYDRRLAATTAAEKEPPIPEDVSILIGVKVKMERAAARLRKYDARKRAADCLNAWASEIDSIIKE